MRSTFAATLCAAALAVGAARMVSADDLYNGKDLTGWHVESGKLSSWTANGEMISCTRPGGGYLCPDKEYGDFELSLEYRLPKAGNSGVGIRFPRGGWPSTDGMEIQLLDDADPRYATLKKDQRNGSVYTHIAPKASPGKPAGEWNRLVVRCHGAHVQVSLNDTPIQDFLLDDYLDSLGKGKIGLGRRPRKGLVGLQSHGDPVDFRRISLKEL